MAEEKEKDNTQQIQQMQPVRQKIPETDEELFVVLEERYQKLKLGIIRPQCLDEIVDSDELYVAIPMLRKFEKYINIELPELVYTKDDPVYFHIRGSTFLVKKGVKKSAMLESLTEFIEECGLIFSKSGSRAVQDAKIADEFVDQYFDFRTPRRDVAINTLIRESVVSELPSFWKVCVTIFKEGKGPGKKSTVVARTREQQEEGVEATVICDIGRKMYNRWSKYEFMDDYSDSSDSSDEENYSSEEEN